MNARRPTSRTTLSCLACLALAGSNTQPSRAERNLSEPPGPPGVEPEPATFATAALAATEPTTSAAAAAAAAWGTTLPRAAARILERAHDVAPELAALVVDCAPFLECLPLERLKAVRIDELELRLDFDVPPGGTLEVEVPERELLALADDDDGGDALVHGVPLRVRSEARTLVLHETLRLELARGAIAGVVDGDLEVSVGPFEVDLDLRTERGPARPARDPCGRPLLALDAAGHPRREDGRWVVQTYELWIVLEALGHRVELGVPLGSACASARSIEGAAPRPPSSRSRCSAWNRP